MTDKLSVYNTALTHCGSRRLASLAENREARRALDAAWAGGILNRALRAGQWDFAARSVLIDVSPSVEPEFGLRYAFDKPDDYIRTLNISGDEYFNEPLLQYQFEGGYFYADVEPLYLRYVSNGTDFGGDYSLWPPDFAEYVALLLAAQVAERLSGGRRTKAELEEQAKMMLKDAKGTDAADQPTKFPPHGSWTRARMGSGGSSRDRGPTGNLIG